VSAGEFVELAAGFGMIVEITEGVLSAAMRHARAWADSGHPLPVAVNVSMDDLAALEFPDRAEAMLRATGIESRLITFEVTEGQVMRQPSTVLDVLTRLRLKRFRLAIDDFGTGHSSLAQLRDLPFDELKIDRGFVHGAAVDGTRSAICQASLRMAQQLRMQVVGEGIEDQDDWDYLRGLGCEVGQGYFIAPPMPAGRLLDWLADWDSRRSAEAGLAG
jgi:EAL domain-containing protein (putative c-di-GMP-specific phosphodiesterase class I)